MSDGIRISDDAPFMFDNGYVNNKPENAVIYYKGSRIEFTGSRKGIAFDKFKELFKQLNDETA